MTRLTEQLLHVLLELAGDHLSAHDVPALGLTGSHRCSVSISSAPSLRLLSKLPSRHLPASAAQTTAFKTGVAALKAWLAGDRAERTPEAETRAVALVALLLAKCFCDLHQQGGGRARGPAGPFDGCFSEAVLELHQSVARCFKDLASKARISRASVSWREVSVRSNPFLLALSTPVSHDAAARTPELFTADADVAGCRPAAAADPRFNPAADLIEPWGDRKDGMDLSLWGNHDAAARTPELFTADADVAGCRPAAAADPRFNPAADLIEPWGDRKDGMDLSLWGNHDAAARTPELFTADADVAGCRPAAAADPRFNPAADLIEPWGGGKPDADAQRAADRKDGMDLSLWGKSRADAAAPGTAAAYPWVASWLDGVDLADAPAVLQRCASGKPVVFLQLLSVSLGELVEDLPAGDPGGGAGTPVAFSRQTHPGYSRDPTKDAPHSADKAKAAGLNAEKVASGSSTEEAQGHASEKTLPAAAGGDGAGQDRGWGTASLCDSRSGRADGGEAAARAVAVSSFLAVFLRSPAARDAFLTPRAHHPLGGTAGTAAYIRGLFHVQAPVLHALLGASFRKRAAVFSLLAPGHAAHLDCFAAALLAESPDFSLVARRLVFFREPHEPQGSQNQLASPKEPETPAHHASSGDPPNSKPPISDAEQHLLRQKGAAAAAKEPTEAVAKEPETPAHHASSDPPISKPPRSEAEQHLLRQKDAAAAAKEPTEAVAKEPETPAHHASSDPPISKPPSSEAEQHLLRQKDAAAAAKERTAAFSREPGELAGGASSEPAGPPVCEKVAAAAATERKEAASKEPETPAHHASSDPPLSKPPSSEAEQHLLRQKDAAAAAKERKEAFSKEAGEPPGSPVSPIFEAEQRLLRQKVAAAAAKERKEAVCALLEALTYGTPDHGAPLAPAVTRLAAASSPGGVVPDAHSALWHLLRHSPCPHCCAASRQRHPGWVRTDTAAPPGGRAFPRAQLPAPAQSLGPGKPPSGRGRDVAPPPVVLRCLPKAVAELLETSRESRGVVPHCTGPSQADLGRPREGTPDAECNQRAAALDNHPAVWFLGKTVALALAGTTASVPLPQPPAATDDVERAAAPPRERTQAFFPLPAAGGGSAPDESCAPTVAPAAALANLQLKLKPETYAAVLIAAQGLCSLEHCARTNGGGAPRRVCGRLADDTPQPVDSERPALDGGDQQPGWEKEQRHDGRAARAAAAPLYDVQLPSSAGKMNRGAKAFSAHASHLQRMESALKERRDCKQLLFSPLTPDPKRCKPRTPATLQPTATGVPGQTQATPNQPVRLIEMTSAKGKSGAPENGMQVEGPGKVVPGSSGVETARRAEKAAPGGLRLAAVPSDCVTDAAAPVWWTPRQKHDGGHGAFFPSSPLLQISPAADDDERYPRAATSPTRAGWHLGTEGKPAGGHSPTPAKRSAPGGAAEPAFSGTPRPELLTFSAEGGGHSSKHPAPGTGGHAFGASNSPRPELLTFSAEGRGHESQRANRPIPGAREHALGAFDFNTGGSPRPESSAFSAEGSGHNSPGRADQPAMGAFDFRNNTGGSPRPESLAFSAEGSGHNSPGRAIQPAPGTGEHALGAFDFGNYAGGSPRPELLTFSAEAGAAARTPGRMAAAAAEHSARLRAEADRRRATFARETQWRAAEAARLARHERRRRARWLRRSRGKAERGGAAAVVEESRAPSDGAQRGTQQQRTQGATFDNAQRGTQQQRTQGATSGDAQKGTQQQRIQASTSDDAERGTQQQPTQGSTSGDAQRGTQQQRIQRLRPVSDPASSFEEGQDPASERQPAERDRRPPPARKAASAGATTREKGAAAGENQGAQRAAGRHRTADGERCAAPRNDRCGAPIPVQSAAGPCKTPQPQLLLEDKPASAGGPVALRPASSGRSGALAKLEAGAEGSAAPRLNGRTAGSDGPGALRPLPQPAPHADASRLCLPQGTPFHVRAVLASSTWPSPGSRQPAERAKLTPAQMRASSARLHRMPARPDFEQRCRDSGGYIVGDDLAQKYYPRRNPRFVNEADWVGRMGPKAKGPSGGVVGEAASESDAKKLKVRELLASVARLAGGKKGGWDEEEREAKLTELAERAKGAGLADSVGVKPQQATMSKKLQLSGDESELLVERLMVPLDRELFVNKERGVKGYASDLGYRLLPDYAGPAGVKDGIAPRQQSHYWRSLALPNTSNPCQTSALSVSNDMAPMYTLPMVPFDELGEVEPDGSAPPPHSAYASVQQAEYQGNPVLVKTLNPWALKVYPLPFLAKRVKHPASAFFARVVGWTLPPDLAAAMPAKRKKAGKKKKPPPPAPVAVVVAHPAGGLPLQAWLAGRAKVTWREVVSVFAQVAAALRCLHEPAAHDDASACVYRSLCARSVFVREGVPPAVSMDEPGLVFDTSFVKPAACAADTESVMSPVLSWPPESILALNGDQSHDSKVQQDLPASHDLYCMGVVFWQVITLGSWEPWTSSAAPLSLPDRLAIPKAGATLPKPSECPEDLWDAVVHPLLSPSCEGRPSARAVGAFLERYTAPTGSLSAPSCPPLFL
ncbi:liver stage antigen 1 [Diplonema papillatum]|nr:liver stage antigen 1 [Diplonema papillatum]